MNMHKLVIIALTLALSTSLFGCNKGGDSAVLARVNRTTITAADFKRQIEDLAPQMQQAVASDPRARKEFLEDLIAAAINDAAQKVEAMTREKMAQATGGLQLPPGFNL